MAQDIDTVNCSTCLSSDRNLTFVNNIEDVFKIFELIMCDFADLTLKETFSKQEHLVCWECFAMMRKFAKFKEKVHKAQKIFDIFQRSMDPLYSLQSLSSMVSTVKSTYDAELYEHSFDSHSPTDSMNNWNQSSIENDQWVNRNDFNANLLLNKNILDDLENPLTGITSHVVLCGNARNIAPKTEMFPTSHPKITQKNVNVRNLQDKTRIVKKLKKVHHSAVPLELITTMKNMSQKQPKTDLNKLVVPGEAAGDTQISYMGEINKDGCIEINVPKYEPQERSGIDKFIPPQNTMPIRVTSSPNKHNLKQMNLNSLYYKENITEKEFLACREAEKQKDQYTKAAHKCELCIKGFNNKSEVLNHFNDLHKSKPGCLMCQVCFAYISEEMLKEHLDEHYLRYVCRRCGQRDYSDEMARAHALTHITTVIRVIPITKEKVTETTTILPKIELPSHEDRFPCLECGKEFRTYELRIRHMKRRHKRKWQCDYCKKFVSRRDVMEAHLKLHESPSPKQECTICLRTVVNMKRHLQWHNKERKYHCEVCDKKFLYRASYRNHMETTKKHRGFRIKPEDKFTCPTCKKGFPTKDSMQDHFNYSHLKKTEHKCPICDKPMASKVCLKKHIKKNHMQQQTGDKPKMHVCDICGKAFEHLLRLKAHAVVHSDERPLQCNLCEATFKHKSALYLHKRGVHKVVITKPVIEYIGADKETSKDPSNKEESAPECQEME